MVKQLRCVIFRRKKPFMSTVIKKVSAGKAGVMSLTWKTRIIWQVMMQTRLCVCLSKSVTSVQKLNM
nr:MAG TPA: hypothetical protein [Caudoviricetes sp.]